MKKRAGFTLVEVMVVLAVIGIISAIAIPTFYAWLPNIRMRAATRELYLDMQQAKMEAIKRNVNVAIHFTDVACGLPIVIPAVGGGYTVFIDDGRGGGIAGNNTRDGGELILSSKTMPQNVALCAQTFGGAVGFLPTGLLVASNFGSVTLNNNKGRTATVNLTIAGGVRVQ